MLRMRFDVSLQIIWLAKLYCPQQLSKFKPGHAFLDPAARPSPKLKASARCCAFSDPLRAQSWPLALGPGAVLPAFGPAHAQSWPCGLRGRGSAPFLDPTARSKLASGAGPHRRPRGCNFGPATPPLAGLCALCGWLGQKVTT